MKILLAVDGSRCSQAVLDEAARRPWPANSELQVVIADLPADRGYFRGAPSSVFDEVSRQQRSVAVKVLADAVAQLEATGLTVHSKLLEGNPKETILDEIERWQPDLVMVGSHGHSAVKRLWLGSVSLAIATYSPCSVEIVRCPQPGGQTTPSR